MLDEPRLRKMYFVLQEIERPAAPIHEPGMFEITIKSGLWTFFIVGFLLLTHIVAR